MNAYRPKAECIYSLASLLRACVGVGVSLALLMNILSPLMIFKSSAPNHTQKINGLQAGHFSACCCPGGKCFMTDCSHNAPLTGRCTLSSGCANHETARVIAAFMERISPDTQVSERRFLPVMVPHSKRIYRSASLFACSPVVPPPELHHLAINV